MVVTPQGEYPNWMHACWYAFVFALFSIVFSIAFGLLYALYLYVEIDSLRLALFILVVSVAASVWQLACPYNKYPPVRQQQQTITPSTPSRMDWSDVSVCTTHHISPDGTKRPGGLDLTALREQQPKKRGRRTKRKEEEGEDEECLLVKLTTAVIRIFYGAGDKRVALVQKSVVEYHGNEGERPVYRHESLAYRYEGDHNRLRYPYIIPPTQVEPGNAILASVDNEYNKKPSFITVREDSEFSTGHRVVRQMKIKRTCSLT